MASQINRHENLLSDCVNSLKTWKELIDSYLEGEEKDQETALLEEIVKDYCLTELEDKNSFQAVQQISDAFNRDSLDVNADIDELYAEKISNSQNNLDIDHQQHKIWKEIFMGISEDDVEEVEQPTTTEETHYEQLQDSEIMYSNVFTPPVDPISKKIIEDPYRNKSCGHVYEYKFILQYIKTMKNKAKCPYMGCGNRNITIAQLAKDTETQQKIENYKKTNKSQSSDDDDDD